MNYFEPMSWASRACSDCTWRCPRYDSDRCRGCRYDSARPNFEYDANAGWGTRAAEAELDRQIACAAEEAAERDRRDGRTRLDGRWLRVMRRLASKHTPAHRIDATPCTAREEC